jgi:hypothetical protein
VSVRVNVNEDERYPFMFVTFEDERDEQGKYPWDSARFYPTLALTDEEAADLRRVRDEFETWQEKLREMTEPRG